MSSSQKIRLIHIAMNSLEFSSIIQQGALRESSGCNAIFVYQLCAIIVLNKLALTQSRRISVESAALISWGMGNFNISPRPRPRIV